MHNIDKPIGSENYAVTLPCSPNQFTDFIGGLLGKPQTIAQHLPGAFEIAKPDLLNIHHLVDQRISQQNRGSLVQFTATIVFNDGSSVLLNSVSDFDNYQEVRPVVSTQIHLSWTYLLHFEGNDAPEKQTIDVSFMSGGRWINRDVDFEFPGFLNHSSGVVSFRIQHTARTWGADIQAMLRNHLETIVTKENALKTFIRRHNGKIAFLMVLVIYGATFFGIYRASCALVDKQSKMLATLQGQSVDLASKLDGVLVFLSSSTLNNFLLSSIAYIIAALLLSILAAVWVEGSTDSGKPSFVLLTSMAEKRRAIEMKKNRNKWLSFVGSIAFSVTTGILGNIIYTYYWAN